MSQVLVDRLASLFIFTLIGKYVEETNPSVGSHFSEGHLARLQKSDEKRTRNIQKFRCLLGSQLGVNWSNRNRISFRQLIKNRRVSSLLRQFSNQFSESATSFTGWLIHATVGSAGGVGILRTNRSGWRA